MRKTCVFSFFGPNSLHPWKLPEQSRSLLCPFFLYQVCCRVSGWYRLKPVRSQSSLFAGAVAKGGSPCKKKLLPPSLWREGHGKTENRGQRREDRRRRQSYFPPQRRGWGFGHRSRAWRRCRTAAKICPLLGEGAGERLPYYFSAFAAATIFSDRLGGTSSYLANFMLNLPRPWVMDFKSMV